MEVVIEPPSSLESASFPIFRNCLDIARYSSRLLVYNFTSNGDLPVDFCDSTPARDRRLGSPDICRAVSRFRHR